VNGFACSAKLGLITEQEFKAACENELAEELEEKPDAE
jgi:hypothetical protein